MLAVVLVVLVVLVVEPRVTPRLECGSACGGGGATHTRGAHQSAQPTQSAGLRWCWMWVTSCTVRLGCMQHTQRR
jgi:hypothetical protein